MSELKNIIEEAFERRADITPRNVETHISDAVTQAINLLDSGEARVAEKVNGDWVVNEWLKKAVYFPSASMTTNLSKVVSPITTIKLTLNLLT